ncbi:fimbria/pilus outer membrane usher protein [Serratia marcescens]|uniref:fimbria/pilus outer membrane usher protein n=1 Tax=Serratia marcescens TaxID=615 RepID=UPI000E57793E|nr:fimbria/pilus outer membrane usher protein [Serratia marcescens]AXX20528.1 PapC/FimD family outer membrane usher protein [Serratia marcescens]AXX26644.1 PapC/FimD family outer membrane usher protein [Serratia marcescens]NGH10019.1 fimbria/pilus outer membrane usher protein [Serratia marcescens]RTF01792.1 PapC/FimD family outer membrane usher protein [Serratia marcescens]RTF03028.1 PapC/FimD family outer membrane usher protein [Serratia marcescens]
MNQRELRLNKITILIGLVILFSGRATAVEFNTDVLDTDDKKNIDFSRFSREGYILPGTYQMQVKLNGESLGNDIAVPFYVRPGQTSSADKSEAMPEACLSPIWLDKLGLTEEALKKVGTWHQGGCADFTALKGTELKADIGSNALNINMPQAWLEYSDASWLPPSRWDNGIPGILLDYNANGNVTKTRGSDQQQNAAVSGTVGGNAGAWRLRADYQGSYANTTGQNGSSQHTFDFTRVYLYRPLPSLQAKLTLGEDYVSSNIFDSWRYTGASLASDDNMLPPKLRGYAPEIIGVAKTNARVTVTQQGRVVYDSTVPAGPFRIQNLDSAVRGQLDVKVTEQNGDVQTFSVSTASVPYLTRPGQVRYQLVTGRPSTWGHDIEGPVFANGEASWGISNSWSLYGGSTLSDDYQALALGVGRDLFAFGTVALDVTQSLAKFPDQDNRQGKSWRVSYSKRFDEANTDVTFAGYRFSERDYLSMQQYLDVRYHDNDSGQQKERYQISLNKRFDELSLPLSLGLNYQYQTYWDQGNTSQYGVNLGTWFDLPSLGARNVSLTLTANRNQYLGREDNVFNLMLSVPFGTGTASYSSTYSDDRFGQRVGYYGRVNQLDSYNLNAGLAQDSGQSSRSEFNGMYTHNGSLAVVNANVAVAERSYSSFGMSANGGLTLTGQGAALHAGGYNGGTRLMVDTDGIGGVPIDGGRVVTNDWGIGVLTNVNSYYRTTARVDVNKMADDMEATQGVVETALTEGAIGYRRFEVLKGERLFAVLRLADGTYPPFGASVRDAKGRELGLVADSGLTWLSGVTPNAALDVAWDGRSRCQTQVPAQLNSQQQLLLPCTAVKP